MCRYAMASYKPHYACFNCRKTFKRRLLRDVRSGLSQDDKEAPAKCPECSALMADMGLDFESPKKKDIKAWNHISRLYEVGITFHSCGCNGPGYIPKDSDELVKYFSRIKDTYLKHLGFWAKRKEDPETQSKIARDRNENGRILRSIPEALKSGTRNKPKYDSAKAQIYWGEQIAEIEKKIRIVKSTDNA